MIANFTTSMLAAATMARVVAAICIVLLLLVGGCVRHAKLYNPPPQAFAALPVERVNAVLVECLNRKGWVPTPEGPGAIRGTLHVGPHTAIITIKYTSTSYTVRYLWSEDLNYVQDDSGDRIHENYNRWITALIKDIDSQLAAEPTG